ncbi:MAG: AI-2E family transporter [Halobacteriaceae archaeon]
MAEDPWLSPADYPLVGWVVLGVVAAAVLGFVVYSFVGTFVFGVFLYYGTRPVYRRLRRWVGPPTLAAGVSLFLLALPALSLIAVTVLLGIQEAAEAARQNRLQVVSLETRTYIYLQPYLDLLRSPAQLLSSPDLLSSIREALGRARPFLGGVANALLHLFIVVGLAFYLLRDDHRLSAWTRERFADDAGVLEAYLDAVDRDFHQIFFGNILNAVLTGLIGAVTYSAVNALAPQGVSVPVPILLGLLSGAASLVPLVGMKLVYVPATLYLVGVAFAGGRVDALWFPAAFALVAFLVVDVVPDLVLRPYVSGRHLHMGMVMFAYILGPLLFGWYGLFLGPMLLVVVVEFTRVVLPPVLDRFRGQRTDLSDFAGDTPADADPVADGDGGDPPE